jgi:lipoprotein signal peptidase
MRYRLLLAVAAAVATLDALTKAAAVALSAWMPARLPDGWSLGVVHNYGVITGAGAGTVLPAVFTIAAAAELAYMLWVSRRNGGPLRAAGLGLILGAAIGNLGEHWLFGSVVDWIRPPHPPHVHIAFDLADVAVAAGQALLIALQVADRRRVRARVAVAR